MSGNKRPHHQSRFSFLTRLIASLSFITLTGSLVAIGLAACAPRMAPVKQGDLKQFWSSAFYLPTVAGFFGEAHCIDDQTYVYEVTHMHGSDLYRVDAEAIRADYPRAFSEIRQIIAAGQARRFLVDAFDQLQPPITPEHIPLDQLLDEINESIRKEYIRDGSALLIEYKGSKDILFYLRWNKVKWYPAAIVFEWLFLTALATLLIWPWLRVYGPTGWGVCIGIVPLLFAMPVYLGYASLSFTSAGPSGGVLYPFIARITLGRGSMNQFDVWLLEHIPPFLDPISQDIGSAMALSGFGLRGPTQLLIIGAVVATMVAVMVHFHNTKRIKMQCNTLS